VVWIGPVQKAALKVPILGRALETICLARVAWSMNLTMGIGMDVRQALALSLRSAQNARYDAHVRHVVEAIDSGATIHEAFDMAGPYPPEFLDTIRVGEDSGNLAESMAHLSRTYHERAGAAIKVLTMLAGLAVWGLIAALIVAVIFRIFFTMYLGQYQQILNDI
jgi:type II secretory pathway component PulF